MQTMGADTKEIGGWRGGWNGRLAARKWRKRKGEKVANDWTERDGLAFDTI